MDGNRTIAVMSTMPFAFEPKLNRTNLLGFEGSFRPGKAASIPRAQRLCA